MKQQFISPDSMDGWVVLLCPTWVLSCTCTQLARWLGAGVVGPLSPLVFLVFFQRMAVLGKYFKRVIVEVIRLLRSSLRSCMYRITFATLYWSSDSQVHTKLEGWGTRDHLSLLQECMFWEGREMWSCLRSTTAHKQILIWCHPLWKIFFCGKQKIDLSFSKKWYLKLWKIYLEV